MLQPESTQLSHGPMRDLAQALLLVGVVALAACSREPSLEAQLADAQGRLAWLQSQRAEFERQATIERAHDEAAARNAEDREAYRELAALTVETSATVTQALDHDILDAQDRIADIRARLSLSK